MTDDNVLRDIGRSVAQLHLKLARVQERLDSRSAEHAPAPTPDGNQLEPLLDLIDAVESALERRPTRRWAWLRAASTDDVWRGLSLAVADARERLERSGIEPVPPAGEFDPLVHRAVEVVPPSGAQTAGTLAATHRRGWYRRRGTQREVLRTAQVSVYGSTS